MQNEGGEDLLLGELEGACGGRPWFAGHSVFPTGPESGTPTRSGSARPRRAGGGSVPNQQHHYSILVQFVNDYFKSFVCSGMALREEELVD